MCATTRNGTLLANGVGMHTLRIWRDRNAGLRALIDSTPNSRTVIINAAAYTVQLIVLKSEAANLRMLINGEAAPA